MSGKVVPPTDDQLTAAFDLAMAKGPENLTGADRDYYLIQEFILDWENGGLTGYMYNRIPDFARLSSVTDAMNRQGLVELAAILREAVRLFDGYHEPSLPTTWRLVLRQYDPKDTLSILDNRIGQLRNFGLAQ